MKASILQWTYCNVFSLISGVQAYADALLVIIKTLAHNSGLDAQESIVKLQEEYTSPKQAVGLDIKTGLFLRLHYISFKCVNTLVHVYSIKKYCYSRCLQLMTFMLWVCFWYFVSIQLYFFCRGSYFTNGCRNSRQLSGQKTTSSLLVSSLKYTMQKNFEFFIACFIIEWHEIPIELIKFYVFLLWVVKYLSIDFGKGIIKIYY